MTHERHPLGVGEVSAEQPVRIRPVVLLAVLGDPGDLEVVEQPGYHRDVEVLRHPDDARPGVGRVLRRLFDGLLGINVSDGGVAAEGVRRALLRDE